ncbi:heme-binding protein [SAR202 cluster bacterium AD-802-L14_MRT_200m]|nr:heme-binding protein [SAR202 cluster bacterium AD-802-L14_MRT_200m]
MTHITLEESKPICEAAIIKAEELGIKIAVSVVDSALNLVTMQKMDDALILAIDGSKGKAVASVIFGQPTGELEERSKRPTFRALEIQWGGRFVMGQGALPIFRDGEVIGACGVGGGTPEEDEICAASGISTL